jgi:light-regulated signal transduction histidine kinase (bacteriophytochrome)
VDESIPRFVAAGFIQDLELELQRKDGSVFPVLVTATAVRDARGRVLRSRAVVTDNTVRKRADEELRRHREHLEELVAGRTLELRTVNNELEAFCYSVSHDLRAPLRSIDGFSQILLEDSTKALDGAARRHLERIRAASQRMSQLIDDLLNLSRVSRGELRRESVDLSALARKVAAQLVEGAPGREIDLHIEDGVSAQGDPRLLQVLLENLLGNAWKFTARHARARIAFGTTERAGERVYFVRDDGAGFDMAHVGKLFVAFQRLHGPDEFEGTGIGLATVARIVQRHGGRVWAEGAVEKGATVFFTLSGGHPDAGVSPAPPRGS